MKSLPVQKGKIVGLPDNCNKRPPSFRSNKQISDQLLQSLLEKNRDYGLEKIIPFPIEKTYPAQDNVRSARSWFWERRISQPGH